LKEEPEMRAIERHRRRLPGNWEDYMGFGPLHNDLHRRIAELFPEMEDLASFGPPFPIDVVDGEESVRVKAELPGIERDNLEITLRNHLLTIKGEKKTEKEEKGENRYLVERRYGAFSRTLELPAGVRSDKAKATYKDGILEIALPKSEEEKAKEVNITIE
jgi:HSP20 family protein